MPCSPGQAFYQEREQPACQASFAVDRNHLVGVLVRDDHCYDSHRYNGDCGRPANEVVRKVTNQVTTRPGYSRHAATQSDSPIAPTCGNPTRRDVILLNLHAW